MLHNCMYVFQVSLWGNKCDLSISAGADNSQHVNAFSQLDDLQPYILRDDGNDVWEHLSQVQNPDKGKRIDIILDNAGFELFTDLCFAEFLIASGFASEIRLHPKCFPWFVSDVTEQDFLWTLDQLMSCGDDAARSLAQTWKDRLIQKTWVLQQHKFWTLPHDFSQMKDASPDLYEELCKSDLLIFKGDLNYRKLLGDLAWKHSASFPEALRSFSPAPLVALRTLKCDMVTGVSDAAVESAKQQQDDWMLTGSYAVIQFHKPQKKH